MTALAVLFLFSACGGKGGTSSVIEQQEHTLIKLSPVQMKIGWRISIVKITENTTWIQRRRFRSIVFKTSANIKQKGRGRYIKGIDKGRIL